MKIFIEKSLTFLIIILLFLVAIENCYTQESSEKVWRKNIIFKYGYPLGSNDWVYSHPFYSGTGTQMIDETGTFKSKSIFNGQFELSKGYFGLSIGGGIFPAEIKVDKNVEAYNLNSVFVEIDGLLFPLKNTTTKLIPLFYFGGGVALSYGDLNNTALFISFGGGLRTFFTKNLGISLLINGRRYTYDEIPLTDTITGDIKFTNFAIQLGAIYAF